MWKLLAHSEDMMQFDLQDCYSYCSYNVSCLQNIPHNCCISRIGAVSYCICSAGCLQTEAVNKGCVESLRRQPSRRDVTTRACAVHQQLSCSPRGHKKSQSIWGQAVNHSQQSRCTSQPKSVAS